VPSSPHRLIAAAFVSIEQIGDVRCKFPESAGDMRGTKRNDKATLFAIAD